MFTKKGAAKTKGPRKSGLAAAITVSKPVLFEYFAPDACAVFVAGSFNDWNETQHPLTKVRAGKWRAEVSLPAGRYEYRFLVDGQWASDQKPVEAVPNPFGSYNSVISI